MKDNDLKRLSRLTAILTQLQTKRGVTTAALAEKFGVSARTVYRDIKALEQAGVPVVAEEGRGYTLMEGYRVPPVMFTESEANALITVEQIVQKNQDSSLTKQYNAAVNKIKSVLAYTAKEKADLLSKRIAISPATPVTDTSSSLALIQSALTGFRVLRIVYQSEHKQERTERNIEPFAFYYNQQESWTLIAYCRLRKDYRMFRLSRISKIEPLDVLFTPHTLTLKEFLDSREKNFKTH